MNMQIPRQIINSNGKHIQLAVNPLGVGYEGAVFDVIGSPDLVAKIYKNSQTDERSHKLKIMAKVCNEELLKISAWPTDILISKDSNQLVGILMPKIKNYFEIHHLYSVKQRKMDFPEADWGFLLHTARNCAIAFESIHRQGHVIGDVNQKNVMVSKKGLVSLVDCDSFQVTYGTKTFRCEVGVPEYTSPELQGKSLSNYDRNTNHDNFGLAILIFHLLMMGRHPFSGVPVGNIDLPIEKAISQGSYAYSTSTSSKLKPPPKVPPLKMVDAELMNLFEKAFYYSPNKITLRPTASEWRNSLDSAFNRLTRCKNDSNHVFLDRTGDCPWCLIIAVDKVMFFIPSTRNTVRIFQIPDVQSLKNRLQNSKDSIENILSKKFIASNIMAMPVSLPSGLKPPSPKPNPFLMPSKPVLPQKPLIAKSDNWIEILAMIFTITSVLYMFIDTDTGFVSTCVFGFIFVGLRNTRFETEKKLQNEVDIRYNDECTLIWAEYNQECNYITKRNEELEEKWKQDNKVWNDLYDKWSRALTDSKNACDWYQIKYDSNLLESKKDAYKFINEVTSIVTKIESLVRRYQNDLLIAKDGSQKNQLNNYLDQFLIRNAGLQSFTNTRILALESFGIETAQDVDVLLTQKVPGIGPVLKSRLLDWRDDLKSSFIPSPNLTRDEIDKVGSLYSPVIMPLLDEFERKIVALDKLKMDYGQRTYEIESNYINAKRAEVTSQAYLSALNKMQTLHF